MTKKSEKSAPAPSVNVESELRLQIAALKEENAALKQELEISRGDVDDMRCQAGVLMKQGDALQEQLDGLKQRVAALPVPTRLEDRAVAVSVALDAALEVISMCNTSTCPRAALDRLKAAREKLG